MLPSWQRRSGATPGTAATACDEGNRGYTVCTPLVAIRNCRRLRSPASASGAGRNSTRAICPAGVTRRRRQRHRLPQTGSACSATRTTRSGQARVRRALVAFPVDVNGIISNDTLGGNLNLAQLMPHRVAENVRHVGAGFFEEMRIVDGEGTLLMSKNEHVRKAADEHAV